MRQHFDFLHYLLLCHQSIDRNAFCQKFSIGKHTFFGWFDSFFILFAVSAHLWGIQCKHLTASTFLPRSNMNCRSHERVCLLARRCARVHLWMWFYFYFFFNHLIMSSLFKHLIGWVIGNRKKKKDKTLNNQSAMKQVRRNNVKVNKK